MVTLLWTKSNFLKEIPKELGESFRHEWIEVIKTHNITVLPFDLKNYSLIFTSIHGVRSFFENNFSPKDNIADRMHFNKIYAVGNRTKKEIRKYGFGTFKVKKHATELAEFILQNSQNEEFIHFCGDLALDILDKKLPLQNIKYRKIITYKTQLLYPTSCPAFDAICFFSPSGVRSFIKHNSIDGKTIFSIGQTTEKEIKKYTQQHIITSQESSIEDLLKLIKNHYNT